MVRSSYASLCLGLRRTAHFPLGRTFRRLYAISSLRKAKTCFAPPLAPPGNRGPNSAIPARPWGTVPHGLGTAHFTKPLELKKRRSARCPAVSGGAGAAPPPNTTAPASWRLTLPWVSPGAGWWVAGAPPEGLIARARQPFRAPH
jgi:hypothetical protein